MVCICASKLYSSLAVRGVAYDVTLVSCPRFSVIIVH